MLGDALERELEVFPVRAQVLARGDEVPGCCERALVPVLLQLSHRLASDGNRLFCRQRHVRRHTQKSELAIGSKLERAITHGAREYDGLLVAAAGLCEVAAPEQAPRQLDQPLDTFAARRFCERDRSAQQVCGCVVVTGGVGPAARGGQPIGCATSKLGVDAS